MDDMLVPLVVLVWGPWACFTRPEMKVERVTYPAPTASAARGVLEAIFWKPEFTWDVREIWVLKPIHYASFLRNEVKSRASEAVARRWAADGGGFDSTDDRAQRNTLALRDVAYLIRAQVVLKPGCTADMAKYRDQFRRRVAKGQCFAQPYLGCREFTASFGPPVGNERPEPINEDLGMMLWDLDYAPDASGRGVPRFIPVRIVNGVIRFLEKEVAACSCSA
jgi:CRISPR-associated protein Cas5d